jgi:cob(I)alamin adenosyltransferase
MKRDELGLLHIYTGEGKGKTTAALGLALRAWGHNMRICVVQFMKKGEDYGEIRGLRKMGVEVFQFGSGHLIIKDKHQPEDVECARRAMEFCKDVLRCSEYDLIILDEVNVAIHFGLVSCDEVIEMLRDRQAGVEVVCTGRNAPEKLKQEADLVTIMAFEKHPYDEGLEARKGIEY